MKSDLPEGPTVSVILCTYDPAMYDHFRDAAESILGQTYDNVELVVVIDGSAELTNMVAQDYGDREAVVIQENEDNLGLLESRNIGVKQASGEIVAFVDDDAIADEHWVEQLVRSFRNHDAIAAGGKMVPAWVAGEPTFLPSEYYWLVGVTHRGFADTSVEVRNTFGSNISFRRDVFLGLGGFNAEIGGRKSDANLQGGETELCARMQAVYGKGVRYNPDALVQHKIFEFRTQPLWLIDRAFWQGYSKRRMAELIPQTGGDESAFLRQLLRDFLPHRLTQLAVNPSMERAKQLISLLGLTGAVGAGYLYGLLRP